VPAGEDEETGGSKRSKPRIFHYGKFSLINLLKNAVLPLFLSS
jgi:hypothetical protein